MGLRLLFKCCQFQSWIVDLFFNQKENNFWESKMCQWSTGRKGLKSRMFLAVVLLCIFFPFQMCDRKVTLKQAVQTLWGRQDTHGKDWFSVFSQGPVLGAQQSSTLSLQGIALYCTDSPRCSIDQALHWDTFFSINASRGTGCTCSTYFPYVQNWGLYGRQLFLPFSFRE